MKHLIIALFVLFLISCNSTRIIPIKGTYLTKPYEAQANKDFEDTWDKAIDLFAQNGLSIRLIDKSSGLIISERALLPYTRENRKGELINKDAWVVVDRVENKSTGKLDPISSATGEWNIRIKKGKTTTPIINVNLVNIQVGVLAPPTKFEKGKIIVIPISSKSTGVFEKIVTDLINH